MKPSSKISLRGANIWLLLLVGLLIAFISSRKKTNTSRAMEYDLLIQKILTGNGYSPNLARIFAAVARHESGNYSSPLFRNHNNFFGMRVPKKRPNAVDYETPNSNPEKRYAGFDNPANSVRDFALYLHYVGFPFHLDSYVDVVKIMKSLGYFEADISEYTNGVGRALPKVATL